jgi:hypothetical protein
MAATTRQFLRRHLPGRQPRPAAPALGGSDPRGLHQAGLKPATHKPEVILKLCLYIQSVARQSKISRMIKGQTTEIGTDKLDEAVAALLCLTLDDGARS